MPPPEGNDQGYLHGSLYYEVPPKHVRVSGIVDYNDPPAAVLALVDRVVSEPAPELQRSAVLTEVENAVTDDDAGEFDFSSIVVAEPGVEPTDHLTSGELVDETLVEVGVQPDQNSDPNDTSTDEPPLMYPTPENVVSILRESGASKPVPSEPAAAAGKVKLKASFF